MRHPFHYTLQVRQLHHFLLDHDGLSGLGFGIHCDADCRSGDKAHR